jgi:hypothetical protein
MISMDRATVYLQSLSPLSVAFLTPVMLQLTLNNGEPAKSLSSCVEQLARQNASVSSLEYLQGSKEADDRPYMATRRLLSSK